MPDWGLTGAVALVTGGAIGIGRAIATALAREGCVVAINDIDRSGLEELVADLRAAGGTAFPVPADVSRVAEVQAMVDGVLGAAGRLDILVNNAAWTATVPALDATEEQFDRTVAVSLKGVFFCCQMAGRAMVSQRSGRIVNIGSQLGVSATRGRAVYSAVKAGVHQMTRSLALEWAPHGVRVNCVAPCLTETPTRRELLQQEDFRQRALHKLPVGRWAQPEDVVPAVLFLSSRLSDMVTGHTLLVDGGWTIH